MFADDVARFGVVTETFRSIASRNVMEDNPVTPHAQSAEPGQFLFQSADVTFALLRAAQGIGRPTARFWGQRLQKILYLTRKVDGRHKSSSGSTFASGRYLSLPDLASLRVFIAPGLARSPIVSSSASKRSRGT
jgi:hypothetical protein